MTNAEIVRHFVEGRAYVDWNRGGAIILNSTGEVIGNAMIDLPDEILVTAIP